jgi:hypothetical protein
MVAMSAFDPKRTWDRNFRRAFLTLIKFSVHRHKLSSMKTTRRNVMQRTVRHGAITAIISASVLSVVILISAVHYNVAQAKTKTATAVACGKELQKQCSGVPAQGNNMLACLQKAHVSARCAGLAHRIVRMCDRDAVQFCRGVVAGQGNILGCLTTARGAVSSPCNAALDAAFLRH